jgi:cytochrome c oxidase cbb3-type subunit 1
MTLTETVVRPLAVRKARIEPVPDTDPRWARLVFGYIASATMWLVLGTLAGEYLGLKFVAPDIDHVPWLSFGRLRPVHTNTVFWGWSSLAMIGMSLYVVPKTSRCTLFSVRQAYVSLALINASVLIGNVLLMNGVNNGGQEYREYIWPVQAIVAAGVALVAYDLIRTVAARTLDEIYISNWYIMGGFLWTIALLAIASVPWYQQNSVSETVIQGFYMHMGVGMWFTPVVLGLTYYALPRLLNKPIYSYSLGVLAFWTQMVFYSMIGAHHFIFAPIPWWLQTVAIIFSVGMVVTLVAGTGNFLLTMRGSERAIGRSYSLPFILAGVLAYFLFSFQGTFEAFRSLQALWHFTNYTVAHSHLTMYGFVAFLIWGAVYGLTPRMTGHEPSALLVGIHFWFALIGYLLYCGALVVGGSMQGRTWIAGDPFMQSVTDMLPYWLWRAVGGTLMFVSHLVFAWNVWTMRPRGRASVASAA